jgi:hypothetical protein
MSQRIHQQNGRFQDFLSELRALDLTFEGDRFQTLSNFLKQPAPSIKEIDGMLFSGKKTRQFRCRTN